MNVNDIVIDEDRKEVRLKIGAGWAVRVSPEPHVSLATACQWPDGEQLLTVSACEKRTPAEIISQGLV